MKAVSLENHLFHCAHYQYNHNEVSFEPMKSNEALLIRKEF